MRLAALALHAQAATSRLSLAPTARYSVVVARAMSELQHEMREHRGILYKVVAMLEDMRPGSHGGQASGSNVGMSSDDGNASASGAPDGASHRFALSA